MPEQKETYLIDKSNPIPLGIRNGIQDMENEQHKKKWNEKNGEKWNRKMKSF